MRPTPLVSVIIPCRNGAAYVGEAISSVQKQSYKPVEIIVVDDGSTDNTQEVLASFKGAIKILRARGVGASAARNQGAKVSAGSYLQFLDADDLLRRDKIAAQMDQMQNLDVQSVFCDALVYGLGDDPSTGVVWRHERDPDAVCAALGSNAGTPSGLHERRAFDAIGGFDAELPCAQDRDFHLRMACTGNRSCVVDEVLVEERRHRKGLSYDTRKVIDQHEKILKRGRHILEDRNEWNVRRARAMASMLARGARHYASAGEYAKAKCYERESWNFDPERGPTSAYRREMYFFVKHAGINAVERSVAGYLMLRNAGRAVWRRRKS